MDPNESGATEDARRPPAVPTLTARLFVEAPAATRRQLVNALLGVTGPLALAALADGRFARLLLRSTSHVAVSLEEARRLTESQVLALARYAWEASPDVFVFLADMLQAQDPLLLRGLTGALFLMALGDRVRRKRSADAGTTRRGDS
jgi:hypothetical protein